MGYISNRLFYYSQYFYYFLNCGLHYSIKFSFIKLYRERKFFSTCNGHDLKPYPDIELKPA